MLVIAFMNIISGKTLEINETVKLEGFYCSINIFFSVLVVIIPPVWARFSGSPGATLIQRMDAHMEVFCQRHV